MPLSLKDGSLAIKRVPYRTVAPEATKGVSLMATKKICDRCGYEEVLDSQGLPIEPVTREDLGAREVDLCPQCRQEYYIKVKTFRDELSVWLKEASHTEHSEK